MKAAKTLDTIQLKYSKRNKTSSTIELTVDNKSKGFEGISLPDLVSSSSSNSNNDKNHHSYILESNTSDLYLLDILESLRSNDWEMQLSNSFDSSVGDDRVTENIFFFEKSY